MHVLFEIIQLQRAYRLGDIRANNESLVQVQGYGNIIELLTNK